MLGIYIISLDPCQLASAKLQLNSFVNLRLCIEMASTPDRGNFGFNCITSMVVE